VGHSAALKISEDRHERNKESEKNTKKGRKTGGRRKKETKK
jgi:hypothetical protein